MASWKLGSCSRLNSVPADDLAVDRGRHPHALGDSERGRQLAEPDGGGGVAHEVEGVEDAHVGGIAVRVLPRDHCGTGRRDREDADQEYQGARMRRSTRKIASAEGMS